jgi:alpha-tubulin suppressor-like RCC1 family protein
VSSNIPIKKGPCYIFELSLDSLHHLLWYLSARDLGALTSTCRHLSKALVHGKHSYTWVRLHSPDNKPSTVQMCTNKVEAETIVQQAYAGGGDTGRVVLKGKARKEFAAEFVSYARFLDEAAVGYATLDTGNAKSPITLPRFVNGRFVSVSPEHSLVRIGGGDRVGAGCSGLASWGVGKRGQLGHGKRQDERTPVRMMGGIGYKVRIVQVSAGGGLARVAHSLLLTSTGQVLSFGCGQYGALGHGFSGGKQLPDVLRPKYIDALRGERCICVSAGELHSAAVTADGDLYTWGDNFCGQLGVGSKRPGVSPQQVVLGGLEDEVVSHVSCGARHTLAVTEDGEVFSWGLGHYGVLGRSFTPFEHEPDAALVGLGEEEDNADNIRRGAMVQGEENDNRNGGGDDINAPRQQQQQVANDPPSIDDLLAHLDMIGDKELKDSSDQCIPKLIDSLEGIKIVGSSAGHRHTLLLDDKGAMYSCGSGITGCLGHGDNVSQMYPMRIHAFDEDESNLVASAVGTGGADGGKPNKKTTTQILQMSAGVDMSMAVDTTGTVWAWGKTDGGRLGLGLHKSRINVPRRVSVVSTDKELQGQPLKAVDVECGYVHSVIVALNGTLHVCGGVGVEGEADGQFGSTGEPEQLEDINIWHRLKEPKEATVKTERWKKFGKYEVKGRSKNV